MGSKAIGSMGDDGAVTRYVRPDAKMLTEEAFNDAC